MQTEFQHFGLSLENRRRTKNKVVFEAAAAVQRTGLGLKAATITSEAQEDVGSPNSILSGFTDEVIRRIRMKREVWNALR